MLFDVRTIELANGAPDCLYRMHPWAGLLARMSLMQRDVDIVREWRQASNVRLSGSDIVPLMLDEAYEVIREDVTTITSKPIDLFDYEPWARLWESCCYASRIVAFPTVRPDDVSAWEYVSSVACLAGVLVHCCCGLDVSSLKNINSRELSKFYNHVLVDMICGRGGVWCDVSFDMCLSVGALKNTNAREVTDGLAKIRMNAQVGRVAKATGIAPQECAKRLGAEFLNIASVFDAWQLRCYARSRSKFFSFDEATVRAALDEDVLEKVAPLLEPRADCSKLGGWCHDLSFSPVAATSPLTTQLIMSVGTAYESKRLAELTLARVKPVL